MVDHQKKSIWFTFRDYVTQTNAFSWMLKFSSTQGDTQSERGVCELSLHTYKYPHFLSWVFSKAMLITHQWEWEEDEIFSPFNYPFSLPSCSLTFFPFFLSLCCPYLLPRHLELNLPRLHVYDTPPGCMKLSGQTQHLEKLTFREQKKKVKPKKDKEWIILYDIYIIYTFRFLNFIITL